jgi:hypothetical protein
MEMIIKIASKVRSFIGPHFITYCGAPLWLSHTTTPVIPIPLGGGGSAFRLKTAFRFFSLESKNCSSINLFASRLARRCDKPDSGFWPQRR